MDKVFQCMVRMTCRVVRCSKGTSSPSSNGWMRQRRRTNDFAFAKRGQLDLFLAVLPVSFLMPHSTWFRAQILIVLFCMPGCKTRMFCKSRSHSDLSSFPPSKSESVSYTLVDRFKLYLRQQGLHVKSQTTARCLYQAIPRLYSE